MFWYGIFFDAALKCFFQRTKGFTISVMNIIQELNTNKEILKLVTLEITKMQ